MEMVNKLKHLPDEVETPACAEELERYNVTKPVSARKTVQKREEEDVAGKDAGSSSTALLNSASTAAQRRKTSNSSTKPNLGQSLVSREATARGKYRRRFCRGVRIEFVPLDLGSFASVLNCSAQVTARHGHLTHLILNAGGAAFTGLDWIKATWMIMTSFKAAVTYPRYKMQRSGDISQDGVGWVWSINVGGSWMLTQQLLPLLRAGPYEERGRVIWTGSVEAFRRYFSLEDMQCLRTDKESKAYESTKYQCDLAAVALREELAQEGEKEPAVYLTHPGVVATSIMADFLNVVTATAMLWCFYLARMLGSTHHCVEPYKGAISASFACLAPKERLAASAMMPDGRATQLPERLQDAAQKSEASASETLVRYGSACDIWGREYVHFGRIDAWQPESDEVGKVVDNGSEDECNVRGLARRWRDRTHEVVERVMGEKKNGTLPPAGLMATQDQGQGQGEEAGERQDEDDEDDSSEEWEKVDQAV